ncbi:MAG: serine O-acetyltransferase [Acidobacteriota bacterium]|nr:serine O-acetyltransferase [Acidobacteriota bacterium]
MFHNLREDLRRYGGPGRQLKALLLTPRVWAIVNYRFASWAYAARMPSVARVALKVFARLFTFLIEMVTSVELPPQTAIGAGLFIPHAGYVILASNAIIGLHCTLTQGVTIGHRAGGDVSQLDSPVIGDRVYIGPGAVVLGAINIGDDALIGANAVVLRSVPPRAVVVGNPARLISMKGSFDLISYPGMEHDAKRLVSLAAARQERESHITEEQPGRTSALSYEDAS